MNTVLKELAYEVIGLGQELKAVNPTYEQLQNAYCEDSSNVANSKADFNEKVSLICKVLASSCNSSTETEIAAKAAAHDQIMEHANRFVQNATGGTREILDDTDLLRYIQLLEGKIQPMFNVNVSGMYPTAYTSQLEQMCRVKDAEIAQLRQMIAQLQQKSQL